MFGVGGARRYHYRLLATLAEFGPASQASLGRRTGIDRSDVVAAINELAADGYVDRSPDPDDGRRNIITLTASGRRQHKRLADLVARPRTRSSPRCRPPNATQLAKLLAKVLTHHRTS